MSLYELIVFVHVLCAVVWVGGAVMLQILGVRVLREGDPRHVARFAGEIEVVGRRVFVPSSIVLVGFGIWGVIEGNLEFGDTWVGIGFAVFALSLVLGAGFLGPESGRVKRLIAAEGAESPGVRARITRILWVSRIELLAFILAVWAMVAKPGL